MKGLDHCPEWHRGVPPVNHYETLEVSIIHHKKGVKIRQN